MKPKPKSTVGRDMKQQPKPAVGWAIVSPYGRRPFLVIASTAHEAKDAIAKLESANDEHWEVLKERGFRCVKVEVRAI